MSDENPVELPAPVVHSARFEQVKGYWIKRLWNETKVRNAVVKEWITAEEFLEITGINYNEADKGVSYSV